MRKYKYFIPIILAILFLILFTGCDIVEEIKTNVLLQLLIGGVVLWFVFKGSK